MVPSDDLVHAIFAQLRYAFGVLQLRSAGLQLVDCSGHFDAAAGFAEGVDICKTEIVEFLDVVDHLVLRIHVVKGGIGDDGHDIIDCGTLRYFDIFLDDLR